MTIPKYEQAAKVIARYVAKNRRAGDRIPPEPELEKLCGVSRITVRRAVQELITRGMLRRSQGSGTYVIKTEIREDEISRKILIISRHFFRSRIYDPLFGEILKGALSEISATRSSVSLADYQDDPEEMFDRVRFEKCDGIMVIADGLPEIMNELRKRLPVVMINNYTLEEPVDRVNNDDKLGALLGVRALVERGCRDIVVAGIGNNPNALHQRYLGAQDAFLQLGLPWNADTGYGLVGSENTELGYKFAEEVWCRRGKRPDGMFVVTERIVYGVLDFFKEHGVRCPEDVQLVGYDNLEASQYCTPSLTSVHVDKMRIGQMGVRRLLQRIQNPELPHTEIRIQPELITRHSTRPIA